jgi:N,N'-diacetylbacillosaminyl-diphospho-undecaprenol alpha-1,3-N-acetylgalactosaminyltransferase
MRIALVENFGLDFLNFRVPLVKFLEAKGYEVFAVVPNDKYLDQVKNSGINVLPFSLRKNTLNPLSFLRCIKEIRHYNKVYCFSLIHSFRLQPNIISSLAFPFNRKIRIINHITGLGFAFAGTTFSSFFYRKIILLLYQTAFIFTDRIIVQNRTDKLILSRLLFTAGKLEIIEGSGIDMKKFSPGNADKLKVSSLCEGAFIKDKDIIVSFTGRLLIEKGIIEFLTVAENLSKQDQRYKFLIAGWFDNKNPSCLTHEQLMKYIDNKSIFYLGEVSEIREILTVTDIFVLPSYREGFPRSVLEAMSMSIPVITTDVPGARDAVIDNYNGLLVRAKDTEALERAIAILSADKGLRKKMGDNGRHLVETRYNTDIIFNEILNEYRSIR